ncbi:MAG: hypothetical protein AAGA03_03900 [Planctomycetota bacterium]
MTTEPNPYTPPPMASCDSEDPDVTKRLSRPATAIIIMSSVHSVIDVILIVDQVFVFLRNGTSVMLWVGLVLLLIHLVQCIGAAQMAHRKSYRWAKASMGLSCVPFISPLGYLGIPFGFWGLVLLGREDYRALFSSPE